MMSEAPEKIYMQFGEKWGLDGSWCEKRIDPFNIEYIRADLVDGMREALETALPYLGCVEGCNCGMQKAKDVVEAALEAGKVDG